MERIGYASSNEDKSDKPLNVACFFLPALSYFVSAGDYFLPLAIFAIAAFTGLLSPSHKKKVAALCVLAGFICTFIMFAVLVIWSGELTLAPPSQWFSGW